MTTIQTYTGKHVDPFNLRPEQIDIQDIAHSLSLQCRFNGHCKEFYSVAEHSIRVSNILPAEFKLWGLLHDATEAYLGDIITPIKKELCVFGPLGDDSLKIIEEWAAKVIAQKFGLVWPMPEEVHHADRVLLATEFRDLMFSSADPLCDLPEPLAERISPNKWLPKGAFLSTFHCLGGKLSNAKQSL